MKEYASSDIVMAAMKVFARGSEVFAGKVVTHAEAYKERSPRKVTGTGVGRVDHNLPSNIGKVSPSI